MENHPQSKDGLPRRQAALAMRAQIDSAMPKLHDGVLEGGRTVHADLMAAAGAEAWDRTVERGGTCPTATRHWRRGCRRRRMRALERSRPGCEITDHKIHSFLGNLVSALDPASPPPLDGGGRFLARCT